MTREELRRWLDRPPPHSPRRNAHVVGFRPAWRLWFDADGEYLGNRSGPVDADSKPDSDATELQDGGEVG